MFSLCGCPEEVGQCVLDIFAPQVGQFCRDHGPSNNSNQIYNEGQLDGTPQAGDPIFDLIGSVGGEDGDDDTDVTPPPSKQACEDFLNAYRTCSEASANTGLGTAGDAVAQFAMTLSDEDCLNKFKAYCCEHYGRGVRECR